MPSSTVMGKAGETKFKPPPRANGVRAISDLVGRAGGAAFRRFGFVQHSIVARWGEIVGPRYAAVTAPESIRFPAGRKSQGVLTLVVEGAHAPLLQHVLPTIVERVNRFFGYPAIERVAIRQGRVISAAVPERKPDRPVALSPEMGESLRRIDDPELREVLESLACSLLSGEDTAHVMGHVTAIPVVGTIGEKKR